MPFDPRSNHSGLPLAPLPSLPAVQLTPEPAAQAAQSIPVSVNPTPAVGPVSGILPPPEVAEQAPPDLAATPGFNESSSPGGLLVDSLGPGPAQSVPLPNNPYETAQPPMAGLSAPLSIQPEVPVSPPPPAPEPINLVPSPAPVEPPPSSPTMPAYNPFRQNRNYGRPNVQPLHQNPAPTASYPGSFIPGSPGWPNQPAPSQPIQAAQPAKTPNPHARTELFLVIAGLIVIVIALAGVLFWRNSQNLITRIVPTNSVLPVGATSLTVKELNLQVSLDPAIADAVYFVDYGDKGYANIYFSTRSLMETAYRANNQDPSKQWCTPADNPFGAVRVAPKADNSKILGGSVVKEVGGSKIIYFPTQSACSPDAKTAQLQTQQQAAFANSIKTIDAAK